LAALRVAILLHERQRAIARRAYRIWALQRVWEAQGIRVEHVHGPRSHVDADLLIPHIDLTVIPEEYHALLDAHPRVVNRHVRDCSKRRISRNLVRPGDGWDGPVIVKTDRNHGGLPEADASSAWRGLLARVLPRARRLLAPRRLGRARHLDPYRYPVFASSSDVPPAVFSNPHLVVERFLPEREGGRAFVRYYSFFGDRHVCLRRGGEGPVVRFRAEVQGPVEVPQEIVAERKALGFDYGKFDFVIHDGRPVLLDANPTPTLVSAPTADLLATTLAEGIRALV
jgi:hypothetical protein